MIITAVDVVRVAVPAHEPSFVWRAGLPGSRPEADDAWLVIRTDAGVSGLTFALRGAMLQDVVDGRIRSELVGRDPIARELLWERIWELDRIDRFPVFVQGIVEVALWDLAGKAVGLPVYQLLGSYRESLPAYASRVTFGSIEEYLDVADQCLELGYPAIKLHDGGDLIRPLTGTASSVQALGVPVIAPGSRGRWLAGVLLAGKSRLDAERVSARVNGLAPRGNHRHLFDRGDSSGGDRCPARRGRRPDREHQNRSLKGEIT